MSDKYLFMIARSRILDLRRNHARHEIVPLSSTINTIDGVLEVNPAKDVKDKTTENAFEENLMADELTKALQEYGNLNDNELLVLQLSVEHRSYKEMAYQMGSSEVVVRSQLHRARLKARNAMVYYLLRSGLEVDEVSKMTGQTVEFISESYNAVENLLRKKAEKHSS